MCITTASEGTCLQALVDCGNCKSQIVQNYQAGDTEEVVLLTTCVLIGAIAAIFILAKAAK